MGRKPNISTQFRGEVPDREGMAVLTRAKNL